MPVTLQAQEGRGHGSSPKRVERTTSGLGSLSAGAPLQSWDEQQASASSRGLLNSRAMRRAQSLDHHQLSLPKGPPAASSADKALPVSPKALTLQRLKDLGQSLSSDSQRTAGSSKDLEDVEDAEEEDDSDDEDDEVFYIEVADGSLKEFNFSMQFTKPVSSSEEADRVAAEFCSKNNLGAAEYSDLRRRIDGLLLSRES
eukprot:SAG31_NODE_4024_length_3655_cov_1.557087_3_plen_200_part_00